MCKNYGAIKCRQSIKFSKKLWFEKKRFLTRRSEWWKDFVGNAYLREKKSHFGPTKCSHTIMSKCLSWNKLSYITKFTICTQLQEKSLPLPPMEKQLRILPDFENKLEYWHNVYSEDIEICIYIKKKMGNKFRILI